MTDVDFYVCPGEGCTYETSIDKWALRHHRETGHQVITFSLPIEDVMRGWKLWQGIPTEG